MKNAISYIVLAVFVHHIIGFYPYFRYQQSNIRSQIKKQIKSGLSDSNLTEIVVNGANMHLVHWTKEGEEFRYRGEMYDIVRTEIRDNGTAYVCMNDMQETDLYAVVAGRLSHDEHQQKNCAHLDKLTKVSDYEVVHMLTSMYNGRIGYHHSMTGAVSADFRQIPFVPPRA